MDTYAFARHALDADPGISGDIIFLVSVLLTFAFGALFIYWFRQENLAKQLEHLSAEGVSVQAFRFDRLEETLRQMSQHSLTQVNDPTNPQGVQDLSPLMDAIRAPERKIDALEARSTIQERVQTEPQLQAPSSLSSTQTQTIQPVQSYSEITGVHTILVNERAGSLSSLGLD
ncbi:hypothetical protein Alg130_11499, partial [Pyrenophora tritici-repentis]